MKKINGRIDSQDGAQLLAALDGVAGVFAELFAFGRQFRHLLLQRLDRRQQRRLLGAPLNNGYYGYQVDQVALISIHCCKESHI